MKSFRRNRMMKTLDPEDPFLHKCNKIFLISCVVALGLDPLFFYIPFVDAERLCLSIDKELAITICVLRSFIDAFFAFHIFLESRTGFIAPSSRVLGAGELVRDSKAIIKRYVRSNFLVDILSILPLPQVVILIVRPALRSSVRIRPLMLLFTAQNLVRFIRVFPLLIKVTKTSGVITVRTWGAAASNFFLYLLASHVIGSFWYLSSIERANLCWRDECVSNNYNLDSLYCGGHHGTNSFLISLCSPLKPADSLFDYGIYLNAVRIQLYNDLFMRFFHCFVWGMRNLSSLGQNLETSSGVEENLFVVIISITGLILFSVLASNIQRYLQSLTVRVDGMRLKLRDREEYMSLIALPLSLRSRVRQQAQYKWLKDRGINEESMISDLPEDLRRDIKRHQCRTLLLRVPVFAQMDQQLIDELCCCLKRIFYTKGTVVVREGYPVYEMLFIKTGNILGKAASFNETMLIKAGDFCGEELLSWAIDPNSSSFPISTTTLSAVDDVEAFSLMPDDLKRVVSQFRFVRSQKFQLNFRLNSQQQRALGAFIIQAGWRRYQARKMERSI